MILVFKTLTIVSSVTILCCGLLQLITMICLNYLAKVSELTTLLVLGKKKSETKTELLENSA